jgi:hypothetical protein
LFKGIGYTEQEFDNLIEATWENIKFLFWDDFAQEVAQRYGFDETITEGRMGGWAAPYKDNKPFTEDMVTVKVARNYLKYKHELKLRVSGANDTLFRDMIDTYKEEEKVWLLRNSVSARTIKEIYNGSNALL